MNEREANDLVEGAEFGDRSGYVAEGYLARVNQEKVIFGPLVECLKEIANEDCRENRSPTSEFAYRTLEAFYEENPSWNG